MFCFILLQMWFHVQSSRIKMCYFVNSFVTCDFFKDFVVLYALYVYCIHVQL